jgi:hypothetical protein
MANSKPAFTALELAFKELEPIERLKERIERLKKQPLKELEFTSKDLDQIEGLKERLERLRKAHRNLLASSSWGVVNRPACEKSMHKKMNSIKSPREITPVWGERSVSSWFAYRNTIETRKRDPMSNGLSLHNIRRFLVVGFGGGAVLIALLVASSISGVSGSVTPSRIAEGHKLVGEWKPAK